MSDAKCHDCRLPYELFGLDMTLSDAQWGVIAADGAALLCATCICKRADLLSDSVAVRGVIDWNKSSDGA